MHFRLLMLIGLTVVAGCAAQEPMPEEQVPQVESVDAPVEMVTVPEEVVNPVPDTCEILLTRLEETQPMLSNLDDSLAGQAERIEKAIKRINRPVPPPKIQDCPSVDDGMLGRKEIIGSIEWIFMDPPGRNYRARVDSGAETSSLSANKMVEFERDGDDWVRFTFDHDGTDDPVKFERPIKRVVFIRKDSSEQSERRVVIELDIRLGDQLQTTEFTLSGRGNMTYPVSLGRAFLMDFYVVDVSRSYTHERYETP